MPRSLRFSRYVQRHLLKLIVFIGCLFVALTIYFQSDINQTHHNTFPQGQLVNYRSHKQPAIQDDPQGIDTRRNLQYKKDTGVDFHQSRKVVDQLSHTGPQLTGPVKQVDLVRRPATPVLPIDEKAFVQNEGARKNSILQKGTLTYSLSSKVEGFNLSDRVLKSFNDNGIGKEESIENEERHVLVQGADVGQPAKPVLTAKNNQVPRRKLNNDHRILKSPEGAKRDQPTQKGHAAEPSRKPDIRIMPKHPAVPEGHSLMVTCADVMVLARKVPGQEAMYMTFELPQSLSRKHRSTAHVIVRPGE